MSSSVTPILARLTISLLSLDFVSLTPSFLGVGAISSSKFLPPDKSYSLFDWEGDS